MANERLRQAVLNAGLSLDDLAAQVDIDVKTVERWITNGRVPHPRNRAKTARALGLDAQIGSLAPGKRADLTVVSLEGTPHLPWEDPVAAVVFGGSPSRVALTVVDGTERYRRGVTEWPELIAEAHSARAELLRAPAAVSAPAAKPAP